MLDQNNKLTEQKAMIQKDFGDNLKRIKILEQELRRQKQDFLAEKEHIFIELLELFDAIEYPIDYLQNNSEVAPQFIKRLPKSLGTIKKKLLNTLERQQVNPIVLEDSQPDFTVCQVVEREERNDLEDQTITKVVRQGFRLGDKILRPVEVITAKNNNGNGETNQK